MIFNENFRKLIEEKSIANRQLLIDDLIALLEQNINLIPLKWYMKKEKGLLILDRIKFLKSVESTYSKSLLFTIDHNKELNGRKLIFRFEDKNLDEGDWSEYLQSIKNSFWSQMSLEEKNVYEQLSSFDAHIDGEPRNSRELYLFKNHKNYKIANDKEWAKYYDRLMKHFFPLYKLNNKISNTSIKKYQHLDFNNQGCVPLINFNKGLFIKELKMGYLELRPMYIEIIDNSIDKFYNAKEYLVYNENAPIVQLGLTQGFANLITGRLGFFDESDEQLKKSLYLYLKIYSNYFNVFLKFINTTLLNDVLPKIGVK